MNEISFMINKPWDPYDDVSLFTHQGRVSALSGMSVQRAFTPMVNARNVESRLKDVVYKHWKDIQRKCRSADSDGTGQIPYDAFKGIVPIHIEGVRCLAKSGKVLLVSRQI